MNDFEREHMVVSNNTMTTEDYKECTVYRWMFMFGHYLGATQFISRFLNKHLGVEFSYFYMEFMKFMKLTGPNGFLGNQLYKTKTALDKVMKAEGPWGRVVDSVRENFAWDFEEATIIDIMKNKELFFNEMKHFLAIHFDLEQDLVDCLIKYQDLAMLDPQKKYPISTSIEYNVHDVIRGDKGLEKGTVNLEFEGKNYNGDFLEYGKETLWWGRRVAAYKNKIKRIS